MGKHDVQTTEAERAELVARARELAKDFAAAGAAADENNRFPTELVPLYKAAGFATLAVPKEYGGSGADIWTTSLVSKELAKGDPAIALAFKTVVIPVALHQIVRRLGIHREIETVVKTGPTMLAGIGLVALSMVVMLRVTPEADRLAREDLAFALSVVLLGLLVMVTRRNAVSLVIGFMSLENGLVLAATGAKGMPLVVEISVAFSILIAFIVIGVFLFRIRERFDTVDVQALDRFREERL